MWLAYSLDAKVKLIAPLTTTAVNLHQKEIRFQKMCSQVRLVISVYAESLIRDLFDLSISEFEFFCIQIFLFSDEQLANGAFILYLFGAIYSFTFLGCICNYYFLPAVECICVDLNIPKDVGAAIVMATAAAMPDFFTNAISTLITDSELGLGSIIGALMYNTLAVAGIAGLAIKKVWLEINLRSDNVTIAITVKLPF